MYCSTISKTTISVEVCIFSVSQLSQISHVRAIPAPTVTWLAFAQGVVGFCSGDMLTTKWKSSSSKILVNIGRVSQNKRHIITKTVLEQILFNSNWLQNLKLNCLISWVRQKVQCLKKTGVSLHHTVCIIFIIFRRNL